MAIDISDDCCGLILEEGMQTHSALMAESKANGQNVHNIARHSGVKKYDEVGPIQAAATEVILKINPNK